MKEFNAILADLALICSFIASSMEL